MDLKELQAKFELKELVDTFSTLSDTKSVYEQTLLFTENSLIEVYMDGKKTFELHGRKEIENAFTPFLAPFKNVISSRRTTDNNRIDRNYGKRDGLLSSCAGR